MTTSLPWTEDRARDLRRRWLEGESAAQIARALGSVTRSAVLGKAHRMGLSDSGRAAPANPAVRGGCQRRVAPKKAPLVAAERPPIDLVRPGHPAPVIQPPTPQTRVDSGVGCRWPVGDPLRPNFHFCDAEPVRGRVYCGPHCRRAGMSDAPKVMMVMGRVARPYSLTRSQERA